MPRRCAPMRRPMLVLMLCVSVPALGGCGAMRSTAAAPHPADGVSHTWFTEHWGRPAAKTTRLFGGETWTYSRIAAGTSFLSFFHAIPRECHTHVVFDREGALEALTDTGC